MKQTDTGRWKAFWREPSGAQRSKTFTAKKEATTFLANVEVSKSTGVYVSPHAGRTLFGEHARKWMDSWNNERTTAARDKSIMLNHVLPQWDKWQLGKIDHLSVQNWLTGLSRKKLSPATVAECKRLMSGAMVSAAKNRIIGVDPTIGVKVPPRRVRDSDDRIISREELRTVLLPVVPDRYRALVLTAAFTGMRWGEVTGLCTDAVDLDKRIVTVIRTVTEVAGHTEFKPFPKSRAGRRKIPVPTWLSDELREHVNRYPAGHRGLVFSNEVGGPLRRTLFRSRVWRPSLVRAGLLGEVSQVGDRFEAVWMDENGQVLSEVFSKYGKAVGHVARHEHGGLRFHDLRHCYGTWLADDGLEPHKLAKVMGHENSSTTMRLYVRRTEDDDTIRELLGEGDEPGDAAYSLP